MPWCCVGRVVNAPSCRFQRNNRNQLPPVGFGQRFEHRRDFFPQESRHQPVRIRRVHLVRPDRRNGHGDAVVLGTRVEAVVGFEPRVTQFDLVGVEGQFIPIRLGLQKI